MKKTVRKILKRIVSMTLVTTLTLGTVYSAYASESYTCANETEKRGVPYVLQCEKFDSQCGSSKIDGELVEANDIATLHDGIMSMLDEDTVINTSDYLGNSVISNEKDTYSVNMYNANAGMVNLSEVIVAENTIGFASSEVKGNGTVLYSKNGDINFYCGTVNFTGIIYAPNGTVRFEGSNINIDGVVIAKNIIVRAGKFNISHNNSVAELVDTLDYTEFYEMIGLTWSYDAEKGENYLQWEQYDDISFVELYARCGMSDFEKVMETTESQYNIPNNNEGNYIDYMIIAYTKFGEKIQSNIITLSKDKDGYLTEVTIDTDDDRIPDGYECIIGTDMYKTDTDEDGFSDGYEAIILCTNPLEFNMDEDFDYDGLSNIEEYNIGTDPYIYDSDFDGINDKEDMNPTKTDFSNHKNINYSILTATGVFDCVSKYVDENGNKCYIIYNYLTGNIKYMTNSVSEYYSVYNDSNQLIATVSNVDNEIIANTYSYEGGNIESISHNEFVYEFEYDTDGNMTDVKIGDRKLVSKEYDNGNITRETYVNGLENEFLFDEDNNVVGQKINGSLAYQWSYDTNGNVTRYVDLVNDILYNYEYDENGILLSVEGNDGFNISYIDEGDKCIISYHNGVQGKTESIEFVTEEFENGDVKETTTINLISDGKLVSVTTNTDITETSIYTDNNLILDTKTVLLENGTARTEYLDGKVVDYNYNADGNIHTINENGEEKVRYQYDGLGQLVREDSVYTNKTVVYQYDTSGNILEVKEYEYSLEEPEILLNTKSYEYNDDTWKDLLTNYEGQEIIYDELGNPLKYRDNMTFKWQGRNLMNIEYDNKDIVYSYNSDGVRISKDINGQKTKFYVDGSMILSEISDEESKWYIYDENNAIIGFEYNQDVYYFEKNNQGDVTRIYNELGEFVCEYFYDAWGNITSINGDKEIAEENPFRYRGYYYDNETGFYYLQSRYYDSTTGRFINADDTVYLGMSDSLLGYNLYTYVNNNPINNVDYFGNMAIELGVLGVLTIAGLAVLSYVTACLLTQLLISVTKLICHLGNKIVANVKAVIQVVQQSIAKAQAKAKTTKTEKHHIIAKTAKKMATSREIWVKKCGYGINNEMNLVAINYNLHKVMHTTAWYTTVDSYIIVAYCNGGKEQVVNSVAVVKLILQLASSCL